MPEHPKPYRKVAVLASVKGRAGRQKQGGVLAAAAQRNVGKPYGSTTGTVQISSWPLLRRSVQEGKILPAKIDRLL
jgi:hypothetical protein